MSPPQESVSENIDFCFVFETRDALYKYGAPHHNRCMKALLAFSGDAQLRREVRRARVARLRASSRYRQGGYPVGRIAVGR